MNGTNWHKDSRYWKIGGPIVAAVILICAGVIVWRSEFTAQALTTMGLVVTVFLAGAGAKTAAGEFTRPKAQHETAYPPEGK